MKKKSTAAVAATPAKRGRKPKAIAADSPTPAAPAAPAKRGRKPKVATAPAPAPKTAAKPAAKVTDKPAAKRGRKPKQAGQATLLIVRHNAGWGNALFLRGEGAGLSWDTGLALACIGDNEWIWSANLTAPVLFKILRNDDTWCSGDNLVLAPGDSLTVTPTFA